MEMSHEYLKKAVQFFVDGGFVLDTGTRVCGQASGHDVVATFYVLSRGESERFAFEYVHHPEHGERYYLEFAHHGIETFSVPIDSWKVHPKFIEVRYYADSSGTGVSFKFYPEQQQPKRLER